MMKFVLEGKAAFDRVDIPEAWREALDPFLQQLTAKLLGRIARQTEATHELMQRFTRRYDELRRRRGVMLYSDMTHRLAGGAYAGRPASADAVMHEMYFRLDAAVTHLLLDEFQDTSLDQWQVLSPFAEEVAAHADGERELLVVGDTKQAIYGWRGGCVELFETVEDLVPREGRRTLVESYRSSQVVLDAVNVVFSQIARCPTLTEDDDDAAAAERWADGFEPHVAAKDLPGYVRFDVSDDAATADSGSEFNADDADDDDDAATAPATAHERCVAQRVAAIHAAAPGRSIGVLVRSNAMVHRLIYELRRAHVPASGEGGNPIAEAPAVASILSALLLADHPGDSASAFHVPQLAPRRGAGPWRGRRPARWHRPRGAQWHRLPACACTGERPATRLSHPRRPDPRRVRRDPGPLGRGVGGRLRRTGGDAADPADRARRGVGRRARLRRRGRGPPSRPLRRPRRGHPRRGARRSRRPRHGPSTRARAWSSMRSCCRSWTKRSATASTC